MWCFTNSSTIIEVRKRCRVHVTLRPVSHCLRGDYLCHAQAWMSRYAVSAALLCLCPMILEESISTSMRWDNLVRHILVQNVLVHQCAPERDPKTEQLRT